MRILFIDEKGLYSIHQQPHRSALAFSFTHFNHFTGDLFIAVELTLKDGDIP